ncbi:protein-export chaperone SecB [bacterium]|nr:protein-export chaperone SecB [bacterium]
MNENVKNNTQKKPEFEILNQFIKDLSLEAPNSPKIFFEKIEEKPNMEINLEVKSTPVNEKLFEVVLHIKVKNSLKENALYLIDLSYGAMVVLNVEDEETKKAHLLKSVPAYLFPFVRSLIADLTKDSGFMPFVLQPINFDGLKEENKQPLPANEDK